jgi:hypothetical protein
MLQVVKANWLLVGVILNKFINFNLFEFSCSTAEVCYIRKNISTLNLGWWDA